MSPLDTLRTWMEEARAAGVAEPEAMTLATATPTGRPSARVVLCRHIGPDELWFFTNYDSRKGDELEANPQAAVVFHFVPLARQVRVEGRALRLSAHDSDAYFRGRPRESRVGAWASPQSRPLTHDQLMARVAAEEARFSGAAEIPRPPNWGGYRLVADAVELWMAGAARLHRRLRHERTADGWTLTELAP